MTFPLSDKFAGLQPYTHKNPSLPLDAPQDTEEFTHDGVRLAYSFSTGIGYRLQSRDWRLIKAGNVNGYTCLMLNGTKYYWHRLIAQLFLNAGKPIQQHLEVDHRKPINGSQVQDAITNLRIVSKPQNQRNLQLSKANISGFKGVSFNNHAKKWLSHIQINGRNKHLGLFQTPEAAYIAYCAASREYHGEYGYYDKSQLRRAIAAECARMGGDV